MLIGSPFRFGSLGNIELNGTGTQYEYRFRAINGGTVTGVRIFLIYRAAGYFAGNGGDVQVDITTDGGSVLDTYVDTVPMSHGANGAWPLYPLSATLTPGSFYRLKFSNPAASPTSNYVSIDDCYADGGPTQPGWAELGIQAIQDGQNNPRHTPCFEVSYSGGAHDGVCWIDIPSAYNATNTATLNFTPSDDYDVTDVFVGLNSGSGTLTATLRQGGSTLWTDTTTATTGWCRFSGVGTSLSDGVAYTLTVTGSFLIRPMQKGIPQGFSEPGIGGTFSDSRSSNITLPIYFAVDTGGGSPGEPPLNVSNPVVTGQAVVGQTLTGTTGAWNGPGISFTRRWMRCNESGTSCAAIGGATSSTYLVDAADVGSTIRHEVTGTNGDGSAIATSMQTGVVGGSSGTGSGDPVNTDEPTISGIPVRGQTLSAGPGEWDGDTPMTFAYQWLRCDDDGSNCQDIPGATISQYTAQAVDVGNRLAVKVTASN